MTDRDRRLDSSSGKPRCDVITTCSTCGVVFVRTDEDEVSVCPSCAKILMDVDESRTHGTKNQKCDCPIYCTYCGRKRSGTAGHYCKTPNCQWQHGYPNCSLNYDDTWERDNFKEEDDG